MNWKLNAPFFPRLVFVPALATLMAYGSPALPATPGDATLATPEDCEIIAAFAKYGLGWSPKDTPELRTLSGAAGYILKCPSRKFGLVGSKRRHRFSMPTLVYKPIIDNDRLHAKIESMSIDQFGVPSYWGCSFEKWEGAWRGQGPCYNPLPSLVLAPPKDQGSPSQAAKLSPLRAPPN